jgi:hypothetical protein
MLKSCVIFQIKYLKTSIATVSQSARRYSKIVISKLSCDFFLYLKAKCGTSDDPGRYLCGYIYFLSLYHDQNKSLFVHVPDEATIPIKDMAIALKSIIFEALNQLYGFQIDTKQYLDEIIYI